MAKNRLFENCKEKVRSKWGKDVAEQVGIRFYEALLYREIFFVCVLMDESINAERIRTVMKELWGAAIDHINELEGVTDDD